ncbi:MAG: hypothetical protein KAI66_22005, partial [Lentisphaeria bacterium]|nr:hypothetical protein [Lentisphaeria bacterium]
MKQTFALLVIASLSACLVFAQEDPFSFAVPQFEAAAKGLPSQAPESTLILRGTQDFVIQPLPDGTVALTLTYMAVNRSKPLTTTLLDSAGTVLFEGVVDGVREIRAKTSVAGTCKLSVKTDGGSMTLASPCAWAVHGKLRGFRCLPTVFLYVPKGLDSFDLHVSGGGGKEHIVWTLSAGLDAPPLKRVDTSFEGVVATVRILVPKGRDGRIWTLAFGKPEKGFNEDFSVSVS